MINSYQFGVLKINGKNYNTDICINHKIGKYEISEKKININNELNLINEKEIEDLLCDNPDLIVIGTGCTDGLGVDEKVLEKLTENGVEFFVGNTRRAVINFNNNLSSGNKSIKGIFHLT